MLKFTLFSNYQIRKQNVLPKNCAVWTPTKWLRIGDALKLEGRRRWRVAGREDSATFLCHSAPSPPSPPPSSQHVQPFRPMVCALCVIGLKLVRCIKRGVTRTHIGETWGRVATSNVAGSMSIYVTKVGCCGELGEDWTRMQMYLKVKLDLFRQKQNNKKSQKHLTKQDLTWTMTMAMTVTMTVTNLIVTRKKHETKPDMTRITAA